MAPTPHRIQLDSLRFWAFLMIFLFHLNERQFTYGILGVPFFFVISGFLITRLLVLYESEWLWRDLWIFYVRRAVRIFPLYYVTLLVLLALGMLQRPVWYFLYLKNVDFFLTNQWSRTAHFWSLCVEEQFYLLFPLIFWLWPRSGRLYLLGLLLLGSWTFRWGMDRLAAANPEVEWRAQLLLPCAGEYLLWGCFAGWYDATVSPKAVPSVWLIVAGTLLHLLTAVDQFLARQLLAWGLQGIYPTLHGLGFMLLVYGVWHLPAGGIQHLFTIPPIVYLGKISYGLYVFHNFMYGTKAALLPYMPMIGHVPGAVLALAATVGLAMLSWHLMEEPLLRLKRLVPYPNDTIATRPEATTNHI
ncbi:MAG: acyltransferase [Gemmataceae bacterium]